MVWDTPQPPPLVLSYVKLWSGLCVCVSGFASVTPCPPGGPAPWLWVLQESSGDPKSPHQCPAAGDGAARRASAEAEAARGDTVVRVLNSGPTRRQANRWLPPLHCRTANDTESSSTASDGQWMVLDGG